jgi:WD40 repeat protein
VLFEEPGGQFASEGGDTGFALVEGDELRLLVVVEEEVEGGLGLLQPLRAEAFTLGRCQGGVHGAISGCPRKRTDAPAILPLNPPRRNGDAPDATTGQEVSELPAGSALGAVLHLAAAPDNRRVAAATSVGTVKVWDSVTGKELFRLREGGSQGLAFSPDGERLASANREGIFVWDAKGREVLAFRAPALGGSGVAFSPDGQRQAGARWGVVKVWDAGTRQEVLSLQHTGGFQHGGVVGVAFSPAGARLASVSGDGTVKVWDTATGKAIFILEGHSAGARSVAFSPDGRLLASVGSDWSVRLWDAATGKELLLRRPHLDQVTAVAFSPDGRRLASASLDATVKVWPLRPEREGPGSAGIDYSPADRNPLAFSPVSRRLASARGDTVKVWDVLSGQNPLVLRMGGRRQFGVLVVGVAFSGDGRRLVTACLDGAVVIWDATTGQRIRTLAGFTDGANGVAFSPDGRYVAAAGWRLLAGQKPGEQGVGEVKVWDAASGEEVLGLGGQGQGAFAESVAFSPDSRRLASGGWGSPVQVWDVSTGQKVLAVQGQTATVLSLAFSADGKQLAACGRSRVVEVWDASTGQALRTLAGHTNGVFSLVFHPDGRRLFRAGADQTVRVWDLDTGQDVLTLRGHNTSLVGLALSSDGHLLATAEARGAVRVWDATPWEDPPSGAVSSLPPP